MWMKHLFFIGSHQQLRQVPAIVFIGLSEANDPRRSIIDLGCECYGLIKANVGQLYVF